MVIWTKTSHQFCFFKPMTKLGKDCPLASWSTGFVSGLGDVSRYPPALIFLSWEKNKHALQWDQCRIADIPSQSQLRAEFEQSLCQWRIDILRRLRNQLQPSPFGAIWPRIECRPVQCGLEDQPGRLQSSRKKPNPPPRPWRKDLNHQSHTLTLFQDETSNGATVLVFSCACSYLRIKPKTFSSN